jgi:transglutaminase-like putative cysteine protease
MAVARSVLAHPTTVRLRAVVGPWAGLLCLGVVAAAAMVAAVGAGWLAMWAGVTPAPVAGLALGLLLARWRALPPLVAHWLALVVGGGLAARAVDWAGTPGAGMAAQVEALALRLLRWSDLAQRGQPQPDQALAAVGSIFGLFLLAYGSAWAYYRRGWFWWSVAPSGVAIVVMLGLTRGARPLALAIYLVGAAALMARCHADRRERVWGEHGVSAPVGLGWRLVGVAALAAALLAVGSGLLPRLGRDARVVAAWEGLARQWRELESTVNEAFRQVRSETGLAPSYASFGPDFEVGGFPALSDAPVARLNGREPRYLSATAYDRYTGRGWQTTTPESFAAIDNSGTLFSSQVQLGPSVRLPIEPTGARLTTAEVEVLRSKGSLMLVPGPFAMAPRPVNVRVGWVRYDGEEIDVESVDIAQLPTVIQPLAMRLRQARALPPAAVDRAGGTPRQMIDWSSFARTPEGDREVQALVLDMERLRRQRGIAAAFDTSDGRRLLVLSGYAPRYEDVEGVYATEPLAAGAVYRLQTVAVEPWAGELRAATGPAPEWARARYLDLPDDLPERIRQTAALVTAGETTPYDKARALERSLRTLTYDEKVGPTPRGRDVVDYFLFEARRGYCEHFASAMVVMARTLDIPARVVTGYSPGEPFEGGWLARERNAHAWAELYFAGYGWVVFEATPAVEESERGEPVTAATPPPVYLGEAPPPAPASPTESADLLTGVGAAGGAAWPAWLTTTLRVAQWVMLLALIAAGAVSALWWQGVRGLSGAGRWYGRLHWLGRWTGLRTGASTTPFELAEAVGRAAPAAAEPAATIAGLYAQERYSGHSLTPAEDARARRAWGAARAALARRLVRWWERDA